MICNDRDLTGLPLGERRKLMKSLLKLRSPRLRIAEQFEASANDMLAAVRQQQLEGVIGKRRDSLYEPGKRTGSWVMTGEPFKLRWASQLRFFQDTQCVDLPLNPATKVPL